MKREEDLEIIDLETEDLSPGERKRKTALNSGPEKDGEVCYWNEDTKGQQAQNSRPEDQAGSGKENKVGEQAADGRSGGTKISRRIGNICLAAGIFCLLAGGGIFLKSRLDGAQNRNEMEALREQVSSQSQEESDAVSGHEGIDDNSGYLSSENLGTQTEAKQEPVLVLNPYREAFGQNQDMAGWLKIEGTKIDYPVMQTMEDENYYLERGFDKSSNKNGCLILDTDSSVTDPVSTNQIIHGHNMKSGEMFGTLTDYENEEYGKQHSVISLYTEECERRYEVIAVFRSQVFRKTDQVFKFYQFFQADTEDEFRNFYDNIKAMSLYDTGVTASFGDRFLTLSTCVYHVENGRLVVVAREIEPGDMFMPLQAE